MTLPVAIVSGVPEELGAVRRSLGEPREIAFGDHRGWRGRLAGRDVVIAVAGEGAERARHVLEALLSDAPCAAVVGIGVAGGLTEGLPVGALVAATDVRGQGAGTMMPDPALLRAALATGALPAIAVSTGSVVATSGAKRLLAATLPEGHAVADLESHPWARTASAHGLPWVVLRVISDDVDEEIPDFVVSCQRPDGSVDRGRVAARALAVPTRVAKLLRLRRRVLDAAATLSRAAGAIIVDAPSGISRDASREAM